MDLLWFGNLLLMRRWVWNAYIVLLWYRTKAYWRALLHSGGPMSCKFWQLNTPLTPTMLCTVSESECTGGRVHTQCNMCHKTCANPDRKCPDPSAQCEPGCECPYETQYWDETQQRCTTLDACQLTQGVSRTVASAACLLTICLALL